MATPRPTTIVVDVSALAADAVTVAALARLALAAKRLGHGIALRDASDQLAELVVFLGLAEVLRLEPRRQPEEPEQLLRLEEERELGDPPA